MTCCIALSAAAHAGLLLVSAPELPAPGNSGQTIELTVTDYAGSRSTAAVTASATAVTVSATADNVAVTATALTAPQPTRQPVAATAPAIMAAASDARPEDTAGQRVTTAAVAGSPLPSQQETEVHLRRSILKLFTEQLDYPNIARRKGWQGIVTLELHIEPDGRISRLHIDRTSGYPVLDEAAIRSLQLASIPQAEQWLHGRSMDLLVPVEYRLVGG
ncbi:MAG: energy transducer TonB [Pseudomonadota bacterium]